jgi:hypothetical protein
VLVGCERCVVMVSLHSPCSRSRARCDQCTSRIALPLRAIELIKCISSHKPYIKQLIANSIHLLRSLPLAWWCIRWARKAERSFAAVHVDVGARPNRNETALRQP